MTMTTENLNGSAFNERHYAHNDFKNMYDLLRSEVSRHIVGAELMVELACMAVLTGLSSGFAGESGIAKTKASEIAMQASGLSFATITLSGDTQPSDITGNLFFNVKKGDYDVKHGPMQQYDAILLDEINRTVEKVWNALLDVLGNRRVVIDGKTYNLPEATTVLFTMNPDESEGTRPLPRAIRDRIDASTWVNMPTQNEFAEISQRATEDLAVKRALGRTDVLQARQLFRSAVATTTDEVHDEAARIAYGFMDKSKWEITASPRTAIALVQAATWHSMAHRGQATSTVDDIRAVAYTCVRHNVEPRDIFDSYEKESLVKGTLKNMGVTA